jgi:transposase
MGNKPKNMLQIKKILQLLESGYSNRKIATQLAISRNTVDYYKRQFSLSETSFKQLLLLDDQELSKIIYKKQSGAKKDNRYERLAPQLNSFALELNRRGVTRYLLWVEYREKDPEGYSYQQFCEHLNTHLDVKSAVMHLEHKPGEKLEIDFAGGKMHYINEETGELVQCLVLVAVLPFSGHTYVQALADATLRNLIPALGECMEYFQGVPQCVLTDNMKQMVTRTSRYEPTFTDLAQQWSVHYNTTLMATRPAKPKDKPTVEKGVDLAYKRIYAPLRDLLTRSLSELNYHIREANEKHNNTLYQKKDYSRKELFLLQEKEYLNPLPAERFEVKYCVSAKVNRDYHVMLGEDRHHYSVPFNYIGKQVNIVYDSSQVEIFLKTERIAFHKRDYRNNKYSTHAEHMPEKHKAYKESLGWTAEYFIEKASQIGPFTRDLIVRLTQSRQYSEQTYKSCLGIIKLEKKFGKERLEVACKLALQVSGVSYGLVSNILLNNRDKLTQTTPQATIPVHENIRGKQTYLFFNN